MPEIMCKIWGVSQSAWEKMHCSHQTYKGHDPPPQRLKYLCIKVFSNFCIKLEG